MPTSQLAAYKYEHFNDMKYDQFVIVLHQMPRFMRLIELHAVEDLIADTSFARGLPAFEREVAAQKIVKRVLKRISSIELRTAQKIAAVICVLLMVGALWLMSADIAHAALPIEESWSMPVCDEVARLASIVQSEAYSQPYDAQAAIAQIVVREARSRDMDICELSEQTNFVTVYLYAEAHPTSWTAKQFKSPQWWALELAQATLDGTIDDDARHNAMHFDGWHDQECAFVIGQICFSY